MKNKGFTIIESLVALTVLVMAIVGSTTAVQKGIDSYLYSKNQITAFYLAQEGFEQIRNMRDENVLRAQNWLTGIAAVSGDPCSAGNACTVDVITNTLTRCPSIGNCPILRQSPTSGAFGYNGAWTPTVYRREITLSSVNAQEISVVVRVSWSKGIINRQFVATENLLRWQQ